MNIEQIIRNWKEAEDDQIINIVVSPISEELTDQELQEATGGLCDTNILPTCPHVPTCPITFCLQAPTA